MSKGVKSFLVFLAIIALIGCLVVIVMWDWPVETDDASAIRAVINTRRHHEIVDIEIADLDGDGIAEIVVAENDSVLVYANPLM